MTTTEKFTPAPYPRPVPQDMAVLVDASAAELAVIAAAMAQHDALAAATATGQFAGSRPNFGVAATFAEAARKALEAASVLIYASDPVDLEDLAEDFGFRWYGDDCRFVAPLLIGVY